MSSAAVQYSTRGVTRYEVEIPTALEHQVPIEQDEHRFKPVRAGRRGGKSRLALRSCIKGHGPKVLRRKGTTTNRYVRRAFPIECKHPERVPTGHVVEPMWKGLAQGANLAWVSPDYPQSKAIWEEEVLPRFANAYGCKIEQGDIRRLSVFSGRLTFVSAKNINSLRGKKFHGVVLDEAAFIPNFAYAWKRVIRPTLIDLVGWAIMPSTTDIGSDFNTMCKEVESKQKNPKVWKCFNFATRDNKSLPKEELDEIYSEYPPGSTDMMQELEGALLDEHGDLFKLEYFKYYDDATRFAMMIGERRVPFIEIRLYVDLASSLKEKADYFAVKIVGISEPSQLGHHLVGVLDVFYDKLTGPDQIDKLEALVRHWRPTRVKIEAVAYQATAVQHLKAQLSSDPQFSTVEVLPAFPDKDKRTRAVPWAAAMARGEVWWNRHASYMNDVIKQYTKFPNGQEPSVHIEDHDDIVDTGSLVAEDLTPTDVQTTIRRVRR